MNKDNCSHADRCKFGENCEREYFPRAEFLCFETRKRKYNQYEVMQERQKTKEGAIDVRVRRLNKGD